MIQEKSGATFEWQKIISTARAREAGDSEFQVSDDRIPPKMMALR
jgi:hypothetical protein